MSTGFQYLGTDEMGRTLVADGKPVPMAQFSSVGRPLYEEDRRLLFVLRESSTSAERELAGLAAQVLLKHDYREGVADLFAAGVQPLREPHRWNGRALATSHGRISVVRRGNTWALYALSSAAMDTDGEQNAFTEALTAVMAEVRPHVVVTGSVSRLVRHPHHVSAAARAFTTCRPVLECTERIIDFVSNPNAVEDFTEIATHAMRERTTIVARMENGNRAAVYRGRFPFQGAILPDGYQRTRDGVILLQEPHQVRVLQECLAMLADPACSQASVATHIVASGAFPPRRRFVTVESPDRVHLDTARKIVERLLDRPDIYESGRFGYVRRLSSPVPVVFEDNATTDQVFGRYEFELPLPPGGWASPEVFAAIRQRGGSGLEARNRLASTNPEKHSHQLPLAGFRWREGETEWAILSRRGKGDGASRYLLLSRPASTDARRAGPGSVAWTKSMRRGWGFPAVSDDRFVCMVSAADLHQSLADIFGSMDVFEFQEADGLLGQAPPMGLVAGGDDAIRTAEAEHRRACRHRDAARRALYDLDHNDPAYKIFKTDYVEAALEVNRLAERVAELAATVGTSDQEPVWEAQAHPVLLVLARLRLSSGAVPTEVAAALQAVLTGFTLHFDARSGEAIWRSALALPAANGGGSRLLGPQTGRVTVLPVGRGRQAKAPVEERAMRRLGTADEVDAEGRARALDGLERKGLRGSAAQTLVEAPRETRAAVIGHLLNDPVPESLDPAFVDLAIRGYVGAEPRGQFKWNAPGAGRQEVLDLLCHQGPMDRGDLMARLGVDVTNWRRIEYNIRNRDGAWLAPVVAERHFDGASRDGGQHVTLRCRPCPHCGASVDIVARVRECPVGLLCSACLRMPVLGSPIFPDAYRRLAARPQRRRATTVTQPAWWADLRRVLKHRPEATITVLAGMLDRSRSEVRVACEAMGLQTPPAGSAGAEWTDERLRREYLDEDKRLVDLADEIGVSPGTLTKRLARAGIAKVSRAG